MIFIRPNDITKHGMVIHASDVIYVDEDTWREIDHGFFVVAWQDVTILNKRVLNRYKCAFFRDGSKSLIKQNAID